MRNFQEKRVWINIVQSKPVLLVFGILILIFAWNVLGFWNKMRETKKNKEVAELRLATLEQQKEDLALQIENLQTDAGKERIFRENYGLAKEGEGQIIIMDEKRVAALPPEEKSFFSFLFFWKKWFK